MCGSFEGRDSDVLWPPISADLLNGSDTALSPEGPVLSEGSLGGSARVIFPSGWPISGLVAGGPPHGLELELRDAEELSRASFQSKYPNPAATSPKRRFAAPYFRH